MKSLNLQYFGAVIDLSEKLSDEKPSIKIKGEVFPVNNGFKTMLKVDEIFKKSKEMSQIDMIVAFFETVFSKEDAKTLIEMDCPISFYKEVLSAVLTLIKGEDEGN